MRVQDLLTNLNDRIAARLGAERVYGEPVAMGEKVVIPVASVGYGFGAGLGSKSAAEPDAGEGGGGGGGAGASPVGALEITPQETVFLEFSAQRKLVGAALFGFTLGVVFTLLVRR